MIDENLVTYLESFLTENRRNNNQRVLKDRTYHFTVAVEDLYQLHNAAAVMRSCDVFGIQDIHIIEEKNLRTIDREIAMGAQKWVDVHRHHTAKDTVAQLRAKGYQIVATTPHGKNCVSLSEFDISKPSALFFGAEGEGLSDYVLEQSDVQLHIPMYGFTESLNISVSAAIILQHLVNQMKASSIPWQLSSTQQLQKRYDWVRKILKSHEKIEKRFFEEQNTKSTQ